MNVLSILWNIQYAQFQSLHSGHLTSQTSLMLLATVFFRKKHLASIFFYPYYDFWQNSLQFCYSKSTAYSIFYFFPLGLKSHE